ncbi:hypothetical protein HK101_001383 [Irineochytrium annulatum]|nr:hypothetical protein HK101_001383 [Irineochytrium annulatum]
MSLAANKLDGHHQLRSSHETIQSVETAPAEQGHRLKMKLWASDGRQTTVDDIFKPPAAGMSATGSNLTINGATVRPGEAAPTSRSAPFISVESYLRVGLGVQGVMRPLANTGSEADLRDTSASTESLGVGESEDDLSSSRTFSNLALDEIGSTAGGNGGGVPRSAKSVAVGPEDDPIIAKMLEHRVVMTDVDPEAERERQKRMYNMMRHTPKYKRLQVAGANSRWMDDSATEAAGGGVLDLDGLFESTGGDALEMDEGLDIESFVDGVTTAGNPDPASYASAPPPANFLSLKFESSAMDTSSDPDFSSLVENATSSLFPIHQSLCRPGSGFKTDSLGRPRKTSARLMVAPPSPCASYSSGEWAPSPSHLSGHDGWSGHPGSPGGFSSSASSVSNGGCSGGLGIAAKRASRRKVSFSTRVLTIAETADGVMLAEVERPLADSTVSLTRLDDGLSPTAAASATVEGDGLSSGMAVYGETGELVGLSSDGWVEGAGGEGSEMSLAESDLKGKVVRKGLRWKFPTRPAAERQGGGERVFMEKVWNAVIGRHSQMIGS